MTPYFSLSHVVLRVREGEPELAKFLMRCLAGPLVLATTITILPTLLSLTRFGPEDTLLHVRHLAFVLGFSVTFGLGLSVSGSVAAGIVASCAAAAVGSLGVTVELIGFQNRHASFGIGAALGASLGAVAATLPRLSPPGTGHVPSVHAARVLVPILSFGIFVVMLCVAGFELSQWRVLEAWYQNSRCSYLVCVGAVLGAALGLLTCLPGWVRLRAFKDAKRRLAPVVTWVGLPTLAGAFLTPISSLQGLDDAHPIRGMAIGVLTGMVAASAFSLVQVVTMLFVDERRGLVMSAHGVAFVALVVAVPLRVFRHVPKQALIAGGVIAGLVATYGLLRLLHWRTTTGLEASGRCPADTAEMPKKTLLEAFQGPRPSDQQQAPPGRQVTGRLPRR
ncbi:MAG TPA: hypothetical protein VFS43_03355 [Polyangiaceae bacterium]|nr:hypothetical protein [Polyangiaceae bacterium]